MMMLEDEDLREEYPPEFIRGGVRGKYYERYQRKTNVVVIDPDLTEDFPNAKAVNDALRALREVRTIISKAQGEATNSGAANCVDSRKTTAYESSC